MPHPDRRRTLPSGRANLVDVWGTGHCGQQVVGESRYADALRRAVVHRDRSSTGELMVDAVLVPEPGNRYDANAVAVTIDGRNVGYLPREDAPPYAAVLGRLADRGVLARVPARLWWEHLDAGTLFASVSLDLAPAELLLPINALPEGAVEIPRGGAMQVTGEDAHLDRLTPLLGSQPVVAAYASLHEITERRPRSERQIVEVRINGSRVGQLTPAMSEHLLVLIRHATELGLALHARAHVRGNALKADVVVYPTRAADLAQSWIASLPTLAARSAESAGTTAARAAGTGGPGATHSQSALPPAGWFRDPAGPGMRWWDGSSWTEHVAPAVATS
jgi:hypothetical protein